MSYGIHKSFTLGEHPPVATEGALRAMRAANVDPAALLELHASGNWGKVSPSDRAMNELAMRTGGRILSSYMISPEVEVWIITEAQDHRGVRSHTTILLPSEY